MGRTEDEAGERGGKPRATGSHAETAGDGRDRGGVFAVDRRAALKLMGASLALAFGMPGCRRKPERKILSIAGAPEYQKPGESLYYASTFTGGPYPYGILVRAVDGRPVKIEGNPAHPVNRGASNPAMLASILSLYDADRLQAPRARGKEATWVDIDEIVTGALARAQSVVVLTGAWLGPAERALIAAFVDAFPRGRHLVYEAVHDAPQRAVWARAFGQDGTIEPRLGGARVILGIESDFLAHEGAALETARDFAAGRQPDGVAPMSRFYAVEGIVTITGTNADQRIRLRPAAYPELIRAFRAAVRGDDAPLEILAARHAIDRKTLGALAADLREARGTAVVLAGSHLPEAVHAGVLLLNAELGALGATLAFNPEPPSLPVTPAADIESALRDSPDVLFCLGTNPVYNWTAGNFDPLIRSAKLSVGHGIYLDETLSACDLALPSSHPLESWSDAAPRPGLFSIGQPVIAPLFSSRQEQDSLLRWVKHAAPGNPDAAGARDFHDFIFARWERSVFGGAADARARWEDALRAGIVESPVAFPMPPLDGEALEAAAAAAPAETAASGPYDVVISPHSGIFDGRYANIAWLQEFPDPVSKIVWDSVAAVSPSTARELGVAEGDWIDISTAGGSARLPAHIQPGAADGVIGATIGHGRTRGGAVATGVGVSACRLMRGGATDRLSLSARAVKAGGSYKLVTVQKNPGMENRPLVLRGSMDELKKHPDFVEHRYHVPPLVNVYKPYDYSKTHAWGMAIDLTLCTGCGACLTACQAENNVPVVGKEQCARGREMHWMRVDRYIDGPGDDPVYSVQPMLCQHCENAPCENVCPVNATTHDAQGLNQMVYNRCVGTRYCSNNCPYKVRRFNFFDWNKRMARHPVQELAHNPSVTVRSVGVMEKCTFCVQRINEARFKALNRGARIQDGGVATACQQACPSRAIAFGDLNDPASRVSRMRASTRAYRVLEELNVKPRVTYLARIVNGPTREGPA